MMNLITLIRQHAIAAAIAGQWAEVAAVLNASSVAKSSRGTKTQAADVYLVMTAAEREQTLAAMSTTETGKDGRVKLAAEGLDFAHPLTVGLIQQLDAAGRLPPGVAAKLLALGNWTVSPAVDAGLGAVTAEQCRIAWQTDRLDARTINATALARERITISMSPKQQASEWAKAWEDAV